MLVMNKHHQLLINAPFGNSTERQTARGGTCHHNMSLTKNGYMMIHGSQFRKMMTNKGIFGASCFQITSDNPRFWWRWTKMKILLLSTSQAAQQTRILMKSTRSANKYQTPNDTKWHQMTSNNIKWHRMTPINQITIQNTHKQQTVHACCFLPWIHWGNSGGKSPHPLVDQHRVMLVPLYPHSMLVREKNYQATITCSSFKKCILDPSTHQNFTPKSRYSYPSTYS